MFKGLLISMLVQLSPSDRREAAPPPFLDPPPVLQVPVSSLSVPITLDLTALPALVEQEVPSSINAMGAWTMVDNGRVGIKYKASRSPFSLFVEENSLKARAQIEYEATGCIRSKIPFLGIDVCSPVASCGIHEPRRQAYVAGAAVLDWSPDWHLTSKTFFQTGFPNRCRVTFLNHDMTPHIDRALSRYLTRAAENLDAKVKEATTMRSHAEKLWQAASSPIALQPSTWLQLSPKEIQVAPLRGNGLSVTTAVELVFQPLITLGPRPEALSAPLPPLKVGTSGKGVHITLEAKLAFEEATRIIGATLPRKITFKGMETEIRKVEVSGNKGHALLKVSVHIASGLPEPTDVTLTLNGKPRYDSQTGMLSFDELDYLAESQETIVKHLDPFIHTALRSELQQQSSWQVGRQVDAYRQALDSALRDLKLSEGITLRGQIKGLRPLGIVMAEDAFVVVVEAYGEVEALLALPFSRNE
ncbi:DUF4403 family protein [Stigmatella sp. ncwal1]|uniref:DUF4403 family protein n=1 Tax=Stigmatella ashevillensis TaxID=2995309 RepID=A0ABT5DED6_9BACT|nr:DUF4403 family protein [Stigmatella ashevillena]MDC0711429.1 DUF4403 family protein [Stigmatella ashevillena]